MGKRLHFMTGLIAPLQVEPGRRGNPDRPRPQLRGEAGRRPGRGAGLRRQGRGNDLEVRLAGGPRDDSGIAKAIAHILGNNVQIPEGRVHARVQNGWVTLDGEVDYDYQRREVERMVRQVRGVIGATTSHHGSVRMI